MDYKQFKEAFYSDVDEDNPASLAGLYECVIYGFQKKINLTEHERDTLFLLQKLKPNFTQTQKDYQDIFNILDLIHKEKFPDKDKWLYATVKYYHTNLLQDGGLSNRNRTEELLKNQSFDDVFEKLKKYKYRFIKD